MDPLTRPSGLPAPFCRGCRLWEDGSERELDLYSRSVSESDCLEPDALPHAPPPMLHVVNHQRWSDLDTPGANRGPLPCIWFG